MTLEPVRKTPAYCGARCLPAAGRLVAALLNVAYSYASAARSSRARLGDGLVRLATAGIFRTGSYSAVGPRGPNGAALGSPHGRPGARSVGAGVRARRLLRGPPRRGAQGGARAP